MLAVGVVDHDHREAQLARLCHGAQTVNARRGLFAAAYDLRDEVGILRVHEMDKVAAVVDDDVRRDLQHAGEVFVIFPHRAAVGGVDLHPAGGERRGDVVLRGEGVRARDVHLRPAHFQHAAEVRRLCLKVHRQRDLQPRKGLRLLKSRAYAAQNGHVALDPFYFHLAGWGEGYILYNAHSQVPFLNIKRLDYMTNYFNTPKLLYQGQKKLPPASARAFDNTL